ncbi:MAG: YkgJ family cysteine cluster protein [Nitrospinaceae bacterium]|jgi:Fe-S-cluster containining protein|nr:YkgJ family cysteine cluster protein [Nitrospinaceae bacterium]|tara:strand:- start:1001 stop:1720 length:720 start_codon:yes stop_codon:yes gene_type:complete
MNLRSDRNGLFIEGMVDTSELGRYLQLKFTKGEIQDTYTRLIDEAKKTAVSEGETPLRVFWKLLDRAHKKMPLLKCQRGCAHCCHTGIAATQLEWDGILNNVRENGVDLNQVIEHAERTIHRVREVIRSGKNLEQVDWYRLVINQPCPFLDGEQACLIYEDRPLDCRLVVAFQGQCISKKLEYAQQGVVIEEAVGATVIAKLQHDQTPKFKRRKFQGVQPLKLLQYWLILWQKKNKKKK